MRRTAWIVCGLTLALAAPAGAETIEAHSTITGVTVFPDRAGVTRRAAVTLDPGAHEIVFGPLPAFVDAASLAAQAKGDADLLLSGVRMVTRQLADAQDPKAQALEEAIRNAARAERQLRGQQDVLEQERKYLGSIQAASGEQLGKDLVTKSPSAEEAAKLLAFLDEAMMKNVARHHETDAAIEATARELDRLRRELAELAQGRARQQTFVIVEGSAPRGGTFDVELSYRVPGATWQPAYEARADAQTDQVEFVTAGVVRQQTGEEWSNVALTLSTARPAIGGSMPELQPWFVQPWEPQKAPLGRMRQEAPSTLEETEAVDDEQNSRAAFFNRKDEDKAKNAEMAYATAETSGPAVTYRLPDRSSVPSDGQPRKVPITLNRLAAAYAYEATPKLTPYAYLRAKVTNATQEMFLPGQVSIFLSGAFVGTGVIEQASPGETFDLYLGADERVTVERKRLKERVEVSLLPGLRGKTKSTEYEDLTTLENFTGRKITVTVFDQVPVSQREEIVVESIKLTPEAVTKDPEKPGVFSWTVELGPTQKQELRLAYRLRHPVDMMVSF